MAKKDAAKRFSRLFLRFGDMFTGIDSSLKDTSLSKLDIMALKVLEKREHIIMSKLAEELSVALSSATGIVDRLVTKEYVSRNRSKTDRRIVRIRLTENGKLLLADHYNRTTLTVERMLACLEEQEQEELIRILEKVDSTLSEG